MITIVYGAPCSGKSTYVNQRAKTNDLIWDWDAVENAISGASYQSKNVNLKQLMLQIRQLVVDECMTNRLLDDKWLIATELNRKLADELALVDNVEIVQMDTDESTCLARLAESGRTDKEELADVIKLWYDKHEEWW